MKKKQVKVRIYSGNWFTDFYTNANGAPEWTANKIIEMVNEEPDIYIDKYVILPDDRN